MIPPPIDFVAEIRFLSTEEGGRKGPTSKELGRYGCLFEYQGEYFDCRIWLQESGPLSPGQEATVPGQFLHSELIKRKLSIDDSFTLREGKRIIATGRILQLLPDPVLPGSERARAGEPPYVDLPPDIVAEISFLPTDKGGRSDPISTNRFFCFFEFKAERLDCYLWLEGHTPVHPGQSVTVPIALVFREYVKPRLSVGDAFTLWEGKTIATGRVTQILPNPQSAAT